MARDAVDAYRAAGRAGMARLRVGAGSRTHLDSRRARRRSRRALGRRRGVGRARVDWPPSRRAALAPRQALAARPRLDERHLRRRHRGRRRGRARRRYAHQLWLHARAVLHRTRRWCTCERARSRLAHVDARTRLPRARAESVDAILAVAVSWGGELWSPRFARRLVAAAGPGVAVAWIGRVGDHRHAFGVTPGGNAAELLPRAPVMCGSRRVKCSPFASSSCDDSPVI